MKISVLNKSYDFDFDFDFESDTRFLNFLPMYFKLITNCYCIINFNEYTERDNRSTSSAPYRRDHICAATILN